MLLASQLVGGRSSSPMEVAAMKSSVKPEDGNKCQVLSGKSRLEEGAKEEVQGDEEEGEEEDSRLASSNASPHQQQSTNLHETTNTITAKEAPRSIESKHLELVSKKVQELKASTRKLQLEIEEKNEIIGVLRDELETTKEQNDKFQRENVQLLKDSNKVKFLQDEFDFLQDKVAKGEQSELEIKRLKEKLAHEHDFLNLRISELEDDKSRAQEECSQFEEKWQQAETKLKRVAELETELNKWKSFSHELEIERNSIQNKLLESIEQENKLNLTNEQVQDEVKRLRKLIKSYEEQRDEEQASNSLIMSVADLKQMDKASMNQHHSDINDQPSASSLTADTSSIKFELDKQLEKKLHEENRNLKSQVNEQESQLDKLLEMNKDIREELESNKKLIADLRQDLACEKSLTLKLTNQLTSFTKQIKNLDKQYFPMHSPPKQHSREDEEEVVTFDRKFEELDVNRNLEQNCKGEESSPEKSITPIQHQQQKDFNQISPSNPVETRTEAASGTEIHVGSASAGKPVSKPAAEKQSQTPAALPNRSTPISEQNAGTRDSTAAANADCRSTTPTSSRDKVPSASKEVNPVFAQPVDEDGSQGENKNLQRQQISTRVKAPSSPHPLIGKAQLSDQQQSLPTKQFKSSDSDLLTDGLNTNGYVRGAEAAVVAAPAPNNAASGDTLNGSSTRTKRESAKPSSAARSSNFVRNSLPSRSVNYGCSSKSSAFLDRIRASVKASTTTTTTTSSTTNTTSAAFNERNLMLSQQHRGQQVLNCLLDHSHSERCFIAENMVQRVQDSHANAHCHTEQGGSPMRPSRQLNALIDPVSQEQLMMSMMQQVHKPMHQHQQHQQYLNKLQPEHNIAPNGTELTEQKIAHLASLHHQHYYHHLQHMHQLHQMHHKHYLHLHYHRLHHKYQQQQQQKSSAGRVGESNKTHVNSQHDDTQSCNQTALSRSLCEPIYSGGSQFYAPLAKFDQVYANMTANNNINLMNEEHQQQLRTRLVSNNGQQDQVGAGNQRTSPVRQSHRASPQKVNNSQANHYTLPQIDEMNGLPTVDLNGCLQHGSAQQQRNAQVVMTSEALSTRASKQHNGSSTNGSPSSSSSSPTSSTSSHLSASSTSSSSSLNSLSACNTPLNRSAALRHTTTELGRRQFSVERELVGALPMTATLSRVGSCRASHNRSADEANALLCNDTARMRTPVRSKQPSMRTSKILNISQQSAGQTPPPQHLLSQQQHQQQQKQQNLANRRPSAERDVTSSLKLASNLASIRLNDSLAFTSLRTPKSSASGSGLNRLPTENNNNIIGQNTTAIVKLPTSSNPNEKRRQSGNGTTNTKTNDNGGGNKSSVWFEYGCV